MRSHTQTGSTLWLPLVGSWAVIAVPAVIPEAEVVADRPSVVLSELDGEAKKNRMGARLYTVVVVVACNGVCSWSQ